MADATQPAPTHTTRDILSEVLKEDEEHFEPEDVYEFSNGRKFKSTDKNNSGIYS